MRHIDQNKPKGYWGLSGVMLVIFLIIEEACFLNSPVSCAQDLHCPLGWSCTTDNICVPAGGCGDGVVDVNEECDDHNLNNEDTCVKNCKRATCGDGFIQTMNDAEECDDGNTIVESCDYEETTCLVCGAECRWGPGEFQGCGDGIRQPEVEECDDGNSTCGSCTGDCQTNVSAQATGLFRIVGGNITNLIREGNTFKLHDGVHQEEVTFRFTYHDEANGPVIRLETEDSVGMVREKSWELSMVWETSF
jgi:cysteine-rich repeat protein